MSSTPIWPDEGVLELIHGAVSSGMNYLASSAFSIPLIPLIGYFAITRKWLTVDGGIAAIVVGLCVALQSSTELLMLLLFFLSGSIATKILGPLRCHTGTADDTDDGNCDAASDEAATTAADIEDIKKGRNASQVIATGGIPALICVGITLDWLSGRWLGVFFAYLACCCGDTLSSELGQFSPHPVLITSFAHAKPGRDGAISIAGNVAGLVGGALVGAAANSADAVYIGALFGGFGSIVDSLMGALLQAPGDRNWKKMNVLVNLMSSVVTGVFGYFSVLPGTADATAAFMVVVIAAVNLRMLFPRSDAFFLLIVPSVCALAPDGTDTAQFAFAATLLALILVWVEVSNGRSPAEVLDVIIPLTLLPLFGIILPSTTPIDPLSVAARVYTIMPASRVLGDITRAVIRTCAAAMSTDTRHADELVVVLVQLVATPFLFSYLNTIYSSGDADCDGDNPWECMVPPFTSQSLLTTLAILGSGLAGLGKWRHTIVFILSIAFLWN